MIRKSLRIAWIILVLAGIPLNNTWASPQATVVVYNQPPSANGGLYLSSWWDPNGSDYDMYIWDNFTLPSTQAITEIRWRGGYDPSRSGSGGPVLDFTVAIYASIGGGIQPDVTNPPLVDYQVGGNAGETPAGMSGGVAMYDYSYSLPAPFQAAAGTKYWVQIEAWQHGIPDWGITSGTGSDNQHFLRFSNVGDITYAIVPGDVAFSLYGPLPPGAFSKSKPSMGTAGLSTSPTLIWEGRTGTISYDYCVDLSNDGACSGSWVSAGSSTSAALYGLKYGTTYYWQVRANDTTGATYANGSPSAYWSFTVKGSRLFLPLTLKSKPSSANLQ